MKHPVKVYEMVRKEDPSGVSGVGPVGQAAVFENGWCAVAFYYATAEVPNVIVYGSLTDAEKIHGHGGLTVLEFAGEVPALPPDDSESPADPQRDAAIVAQTIRRLSEDGPIEDDALAALTRLLTAAREVEAHWWDSILADTGVTETHGPSNRPKKEPTA